MKRVAAILFVTVVAGASCFDPLYEDGAPLTSSWVLCCQSGSVNTCFCEEATSCEQRFFACAGSRCSPTPSCSTGSGGGAGAGGGAGTGGGASGGGGGGIADAGTTADAGVFDGGAGGGSGGGAGGGGGGAASTGFEFCCVLSHVTTCACPSTGCAHESFTPCPGGACVAGTATALCR